MAKKEEVVIVPLTKKQKVLNVLKIVGISFGAVLGIIAAVVLYVWISGGFNPPYVPLTEMHFSKNEYVISDLDNIALVPNDGCTELDNVTLTIEDTNIVALVEDDYTTAIKNNEGNEPEAQADDDTTTVANKYYVTIGQNIQITPIKQTLNAGTADEKQVNVGGWVKLVAERGLIQTDCWVYVDVPVESLDLIVNTQLEKVEPEQGQEQEFDTYVVYPSSTISLGVTNNFPAKSFNLPSTTLSTHPTGKTSTEYLNKKNVYYVVSDETLATVNNDTGVVTVKQNVEGSFTVYAYVVSKYNDLGNEPNLEDYINAYGEQEGFINWEQDFDNIRIKTQKIEFKIKEITVETLSVAKEKLTFNLLSNNNKVQVNYVNTNSNIVDTSHSNIYHYAVDISLSYASASKDIMFENIQLFSGYIDNNATGETIFVNNNFIVLDDTYIKISAHTINRNSSPRQLSWDVVINEYKAYGNVLVFAYPIKDDTGNITDYIYDYAEVNINKVAVDGLSFSSLEKEINLSWNDTQGLREIKDLNNTVTVSPSNATYNKYIRYFAPSDNNILEVDKNLKIKTIDGKDYYAICQTDDEGNKNYNIINPIELGNKTSVVAVVLIYDANGELLQQDGYYNFDYIGNLSDSITVSVIKNLKVEGVDVLETNGTSINNNNTVTVAKGDTFVLEITCDEAIIDDTVFTWAIEGDINQDMLSQTNSVRTEGKKLIYTLTANRDGSASIYIADKNGNKLTYISNINIEILNTELQALELSTTAEYGVSVKLTEDSYAWKVLDENGNITDQDLSFSIKYNPENTNNKTIAIAAYKLPDNFTQDQIDSLSPETLTLSDMLTFEQNYDDGTKIIPTINKSGKAVVFATSLSGDIVSNPIIVQITIPEIRVEFTDEKQQQLIAVDGLEKSLTTYDKFDELEGRQGNKYSVGVYTKTKDTSVNKQKTYYVIEDDNYVVVSNPSTNYIADYYEFTDISALVSYKFAGEYTIDEDGLLVSESGIKINNTARTLILCNIDNDVQETIIMYTDFGYESTQEQSFVYDLISDYNVETVSNKYYAPGLIDVFADGSVKFTNKAGTILYLPESYNISNLDTEYLSNFAVAVDSPVDDEIGSYYELKNGDYVLTADKNVVVSKTYYKLNISYSLTISVFGTYCSPEYDIDSKVTGKIKIYRIPEDETSISAVISVLKENGSTGYSAQLLFTIIPAVSSNFEANGYDANSNQVLVVDTSVSGVEGSYTFAGGNSVVLVDNDNTENSKLQYNKLNDSQVEITSIKFSSNYIALVGVDTVDGDGTNVCKFVLTTDTKFAYDKQYYIQTVSCYKLAELPTPISLGLYELKDSYVLSADTRFDYQKTYYVRTTTGYQVAELPNPASLEYYEITNTYAQIVQYQLATEFDSSKTYYIKTTSGYSIVTNPVESDLGAYYEVVDYDSAQIAKQGNDTVLTLLDDLLLNDISDFQIKLEVKANVEKDGITTKITSYYIIKFELPKGN